MEARGYARLKFIGVRREKKGITLSDKARTELALLEGYLPRIPVDQKKTIKRTRLEIKRLRLIVRHEEWLLTDEAAAELEKISAEFLANGCPA